MNPIETSGQRWSRRAQQASDQNPLFHADFVDLVSVCGEPLRSVKLSVAFCEVREHDGGLSCRWSLIGAMRLAWALEVRCLLVLHKGGLVLEDAVAVVAEDDLRSRCS